MRRLRTARPASRDEGTSAAEARQRITGRLKHLGWVRPGSVLRLRTITGRTGEAEIKAPVFKVSGAQLCNGLEVPGRQLSTKEHSMVPVNPTGISRCNAGRRAMSGSPTVLPPNVDRSVGPFEHNRLPFLDRLTDGTGGRSVPESGFPVAHGKCCHGPGLRPARFQRPSSPADVR